MPVSEATGRAPRAFSDRVESGNPKSRGQVAEAKRLVRALVARLASAGAADDGAFAVARARSLRRAGHSRCAVAAYLSAKGVAGETARAALPDGDDAEPAAALALAARRRIGPFRRTDAVADEDQRRREQGVLARAGFTQSVTSRVLRMQLDEAEDLLHRLRRGMSGPRPSRRFDWPTSRKREPHRRRWSAEIGGAAIASRLRQLKTQAAV